jgi:hypothetical protein
MLLYASLRYYMLRYNTLLYATLRYYTLLYSLYSLYATLLYATLRYYALLYGVRYSKIGTPPLILSRHWPYAHHLNNIAFWYL